MTLGMADAAPEDEDVVTRTLGYAADTLEESSNITVFLVNTLDDVYPVEMATHNLIVSSWGWI